jgi:hypothetical protein
MTETRVAPTGSISQLFPHVESCTRLPTLCMVMGGNYHYSFNGRSAWATPSRGLLAAPAWFAHPAASSRRRFYPAGVVMRMAFRAAVSDAACP